MSWFPDDRPGGYDPDKYWDEATETWVTTRITIPGNRIEWLLVIGEEGEIYYRSI